MEQKGRLIIVSNRLPISVTKDGEGLKISHNVGGLATGLGSFYRNYNAAWIGWAEAGMIGKAAIQKKLEDEFSCYPVFLPKSLSERYYAGFSNKTLWPLFHSFPPYADYSLTYWEAYKQVNKLFSERIAQIIQPEDTVWINDYHHMILPRYVRKKVPDAKIGFFLHTPFPTYDIIKMLPWYKELLEGVLYSDLIGFHTYDYVSAFLEAVRVLLGYDNEIGSIKFKSRVVKADSFPMGIDFDKFNSVSGSPEVKAEAILIRKFIGDKMLIFSISRLDYTKGILEQLRSIQRLLELRPDLADRLIYALVVVPSRENLEHYHALQKQINEAISDINGRYGKRSGMIVWYINEKLSFNRLVAFYKTTDIMMVLPIKDGMNLVAKEFLASKKEGSGLLILSETAGSAKELFDAAIVNPNDENGVAREIIKYMDSGKLDRRYNLSMRNRLRSKNVTKWAEGFISELDDTLKASKAVAPHLITESDKKSIMDAYSLSTKRLLLLDYDGTLVNIRDDFRRASMSQRVKKAMDALCRARDTDVWVISGRTKHYMNSTFPDPILSLATEHGGFYREKGSLKWNSIIPIDMTWKRKIMPLLRLYTERLKGSAIEEKEASITWHYRNAIGRNPDDVALELGNIITNLSANSELKVLYGKKTIDIVNANLNKGIFYLKQLSNKSYDFIMAVGDDNPDEDLFGVLPSSAFSIRIGISPTKAKYNSKSRDEVERLLSSIAALPAGKTK